MWNVIEPSRSHVQTSIAKSIMQTPQYPGDASSVIRSRRWTHDDAAETIGFNGIRKVGKVSVGLQLFPAPQIEYRLIFLSGKLDFQRHGETYVPRNPSLACFRQYDA